MDNFSLNTLLKAYNVSVFCTTDFEKLKLVNDKKKQRLNCIILRINITFYFLVNWKVTENTCYFFFIKNFDSQKLLSS